MESTDREILIEVCNGQVEMSSRLGSIESRLGRLEQSIAVLHEDSAVMSARLDMAIWGGGLCFGVLGFLVTFVSIFAPKLWEKFTRNPSPSPETVRGTSLTVSEVLELIRLELGRRRE